MFGISDINERLRKKLSLGELGVLVAVFLLNVYLLIFISKGYLIDYRNYIAGAQGDFDYFFYGYWLLVIIYPFSRLPIVIGYLIWSLLNILGTWFAARVFNQNPIFALISYQMASVLYFGQITGILCGLIAIFWWAMHQQKYLLGGMALLFAIAKPQTGGLLAILLWLFAEIPWRQKLRIWIIPCLGIMITFVLSPTWLYDIYMRIGNVIQWSNISLRQWVGWWALLLYLPVFLLPMNRQNRFLMTAAVSIMNLPYFLQQDLLALLIFPVGWLPVLLGYIPAGMFVYYEFAGHPSGVVVPLYIFFKFIYQSFANWKIYKNKVVQSV